MAKSTVTKKQTNLVYLNPEKVKRAEGIVAVLNGGPVSPHLRACYSPDGIAEIIGKFTNLLKERGVEADSAGAFHEVYIILGGGTRTQEQEAKIRAHVAGKKSQAKKDDEEENGPAEVDESDKDEDE